MGSPASFCAPEPEVWPRGLLSPVLVAPCGPSAAIFVSGCSGPRGALTLQAQCTCLASDLSSDLRATSPTRLWAFAPRVGREGPTAGQRNGEVSMSTGFGPV